MTQPATWRLLSPDPITTERDRALDAMARDVIKNRWNYADPEATR